MPPKLVQVDITFHQQAFNTGQPQYHIQNGEKLTYQLNKNYKGIAYDNNPAFVEKTFISPDTISVGNAFGIVQGQPNDIFGDFDGRVLTIEYFRYETGNVNLIAVGGRFDTYVKNGVTTTCNKFVILNVDGTVYNNSTFNYAIIDDINSDVNIIKYHELNETLLIGGVFPSVNADTTIPNFFELDIATQAVSTNTSNYSTAGAINGPVTAMDVRQINGDIIIGGDFSNAYGGVADKLLLLRLDLTEGLTAEYTNFRNVIDSGLGNYPNKIVIKQEGTFQVAIGGPFSATDGTVTRNNFILLNSNGNIDTRFLSTDGIVQDIEYITGGYYIVGNFDFYGTLGINKILAVNTTGGARPIYFEEDVNNIRRIKKGEGDKLYISFTPTTQAFNFCTFNLRSYVLSDKKQVIDSVEVIEYFSDDNPATSEIIAVGGNITTYSQEVTNLAKNEVLLNNASMEGTRDNLYNNLVEENSITDGELLRYLKISNNVIRIEIVIPPSSDDIYFLSNTSNLFNRVTLFEERNDGSLIRNITITPIRRDFVINGVNNPDSSSTKFNIGLFDDFLNGLDNSLIINKPRISNEIENNYLNISRVIPRDTLNPNLEYYLDLPIDDFIGIKIDESNHGKFYNSTISSLQNDVVLNETSNVFYVLDGYTYDKTKSKDKVLINGNKRLVVRDGLIRIPFLSWQIEDIQFSADGVAVLNAFGPFQPTIDPTDSDGFVKYLSIDLSNSFWINANYLDVDFKIKPEFVFGDEPTNEIIRIYFDDTCTVFKPTRVIFKNSYGMYEEIWFKGRYSSSVTNDSEEYSKSIYSYRGQGTKYGHLRTEFNKNPTREWVVNTGNTIEGMNPALEDMVNSEQVWFEADGVVTPVVVDETSFDNRLEYVDGVLNYRFRFIESKTLTQQIVN